MTMRPVVPVSIHWCARFGCTALLALTLLMSGCAWAPGTRVQQPDQPTAQTEGLDLRLQTINADLLEQLKVAQTPAIATDFALGPITHPYLLGPGDVLSIQVWGHPELSLPAVAVVPAQDASVVPHGHTITQQGDLQFAHIGLLPVAGLTETQARDALALALSHYLKTPQITLRVQAYRSQKVYIEGEVRNPGQQTINDIPMTLAEALARAGGITALADSSQVVVLRQGRRHVFNLPAMVQSGLSPASVLLRHGDLVRVTPREETKVSVLGEVVRPGMQTLRQGRLSLNEALAEAGGLQAASANASQIYVVRGLADGTAPQVFHLDARSPFMLAWADRFPLQGRDIVYVDAAPLALWNRVITLLAPTATATQTTTNTLNNR